MYMQLIHICTHNSVWIEVVGGNDSQQIIDLMYPEIV